MGDSLSSERKLSGVREIERVERDSASNGREGMSARIRRRSVRTGMLHDCHWAVRSCFTKPPLAISRTANHSLDESPEAIPDVLWLRTSEFRHAMSSESVGENRDPLQMRRWPASWNSLFPCSFTQ